MSLYTSLIVPPNQLAYFYGPTQITLAPRSAPKRKILEIHVLHSKQEPVDNDSTVNRYEPDPNSTRSKYDVAPLELQQCIDSTADQIDKVASIKITVHKGVHEITFHIDSNHVCDVSTNKAKTDIRLKAVGTCALSLESTLSGVPFWEWNETPSRAGCTCAIHHNVKISGFTRPVPSVLVGSRPTSARSSLGASLISRIATKSVLGRVSSMSTMHTVAPPVCMPEPRGTSMCGSYSDIGTARVLSTISIDGIPFNDSPFSESSISSSRQLTPYSHYGAVPSTAKVSSGPDLLHQGILEETFRKTVFPTTCDDFLNIPAHFRQSHTISPALLPIRETEDEEHSVAEADDTGASTCSIAVPTLASSAPVAASMDSLLFLAYLSGVTHALKHKSRSSVQDKPSSTHIQGCVYIPDPPEVDLNEYMMHVFLSAAAAASPERGTD